MGDLDEWAVESINQPYDKHGNMLEPVVVLKMFANAAAPLYPMTKQQKTTRKYFPLTRFLDLKGIANQIDSKGQVE